MEFLGEPSSIASLNTTDDALLLIKAINKESLLKEGSSIILLAKIVSEFKPEFLRQSFESLVARHSSLRTLYKLLDETVVPSISENNFIDFEEVDAKGWSTSQLYSTIDDDQTRALDLESGPLLRVRLYNTSKKETLLLLAVHKNAVDLWSFVVLLDDFRIIFNGGSYDRRTLPTIDIQYLDYCQWLKDWLHTFEGQKSLLFWQKQLIGELPILLLPTDRPSRPNQPIRGASHTFRITSSIRRKLTFARKRDDLYLYNLMLSTLQVLLYRYSGQEDIIVGTTVSCRDRHGLENCVGPLVNKIALRANMAGNPPFRRFMRNNKKVISSCFSHHEYPFDVLVRRLRQTRDSISGRNPIFQVMFEIFSSAEMSRLAPFVLGEPGWKIGLGSFEIESIAFQHRPLDVDLSFVIAEVDNELVASIRYNSELFDEDTIVRMSDHYQVLLSHVCDRPDQPLQEIPLITEKECNQILHEFNNTQEDFPSNSTLPSMFEDQVAQVPETPAVIAVDGKSLTYSELNRQANQLAHYLRSSGNDRGNLIGLCVPRSCEMIVVVIAILKARCVYVPIDPAYPKERITYMLENAGVRTVISVSSLASQLSIPSSVTILCIDDLSEALQKQSSENIICNQPLDDLLAYIIYTSGSTGLPKGVAMLQSALVNLIWWENKKNTVCEKGRTLQFAPISFDVSFQEIFATLTSGGTLYTINEDLRIDMINLVRYIGQHSMERIFLPYVALNHMCELTYSMNLIPKSLKEVVTAGEQLQISNHLIHFFEALPDCVLHNHYGPSETHVVTNHTLVGSPSSWPPLPPIGKPIANSKVYILDTNMKLLPIGVPGEVYLGGACLASGYINKPEITSQKFVRDPFSKNPKDRLYRTGDLGRLLKSGTVEFFGRVDFQVKIRGFRVELGEVEAVLGQHNGIRKVAVVARDDGKEKVLVAYVVTEKNSPPTTDELRAFVRSKLPAYMVPSIFVVLDSFPLTPSGKVDRKALPAPDTVAAAQSAEESGTDLPSTDTELTLLKIWSNILGVPKIRLHDNFFELGGHSLKVGQLVARIHSTFGCEVPITTVFKTPTIAGLVRIIDAQNGGRESVVRSSVGGLVDSAREVTQQSEGQVMVPVAEPNTPYPLSFNQESLWFMSRTSSAVNIAYNINIGFKIHSTVSPAALRKTLHDLVRRHSALRTSYKVDSATGRPIQIIRDEFFIDLVEVDASSWSTDQVRDDMTVLGAQPFDLECDTLVRARLYVGCHSGETVSNTALFLSFHHIAVDLWSLILLFEDFGNYYSTEVSGHYSNDSCNLFQYVDYARWHARNTLGVEGEKHWLYWKEQLSGDLPVITLPYDKPRPPTVTYNGASHDIKFTTDLTEKLRGLAKMENATTFSVLLSVFQTLLYRYSGQTDILIGTPMACRTSTEVESIVGYFINPTVIRCKFDDAKISFGSLVDRTQSTAISALQHQDYPFPMLVERLKIPRDTSRSPIFQVMFVYQKSPKQDGDDLVSLILGQEGTRTTLGSKLDVEALHVSQENGQFELVLVANESNGKLSCSFQYNTDLFNEETIRRMSDHFILLASSAVANPSASISSLNLMSKEETSEAIHGFGNSKTMDYPKDKCIHHLFEERVALTPNALALSDGKISLTYHEMNEQANKIANYLKRIEPTEKAVIGLCTGRCIGMFVSMFGVLKAGFAYLSIDPGYPPDRISYMVEDSGASGVIVTNKHSAVLSDVKNARIISIDHIMEEIDQESADPPKTTVTSEDLINMIYTSGSTGKPKGVMVHHRGMVNLVTWHRSDYKVTCSSRASQLVGAGFDPVGLEVFPFLTAGGSLHIMDDETRANPPKLLEWLAAKQITHTLLPTPIAEAIFELVLPEDLCLQVMYTGGDKLHRGFRKPVAFRFDNHYGPSECTIMASYYTIPTNLESSPPIGVPVANTQLYVVDKHMNLVPINVPGELLIGGDGVTKGYLNRPDLTSEKFIPNPFSKGLVYMTGDLVRRLPDGNLEFISRVDQQIKIRGYRIELGEIESCIVQHPSVKENVVIVREDTPGVKRLAAYLVVDELQFSLASLKSFLKSKLPDYMVPSHFVIMKSLPLTPNNKVDRKALPNPKDVGDYEGAIVAARKPEEEMMSAVWQKVLNTNLIGIQDNFFEVGGHSLLASQLVSRIRETFHVDIPLTTVFEQPTIESLTSAVMEAVGDLKSVGETTVEAAIKKAEHDDRYPAGVYPLSHNQKSIWLIYKLNPSSTAYNVLFAARILSPLNIQALRNAMKTLLTRNPILRTVYGDLYGEPVQIIQKEFTVAFEQINAARWDRATIHRALLTESHLPFDLEKGPVFRAKLYTVSSREHYLLLCFHHIAVDGWSIDLILRQLVETYEGATGIGLLSPESELQYTDFAKWQLDTLSGYDGERMWSYWQRQLEGRSPILNLFSDYSRPPVQTYVGTSYFFSIPESTTEKLNSLAKEERTTLYSVLLSAFYTLLHYYTSQEDIIVGSPVACRNKLEVEKMIGYFVNSMPLLGDLSGNPTFRSLLVRVRRMILAALAHQDYPFSLIVEKLGIERDPSRSPLFQTMFILEKAFSMNSTSSFIIGKPGTKLTLGSLDMESIPLQQEIAQVDITLVVCEDERHLTGYFQYNKDLFTEERIKSMSAHFVKLLKEITDDPELRLAELKVLTKEEQRRIIEWNSTDALFPKDKCIHQLFERKVEKLPKALALKHQGRELTYDELNRKANKLSRYLSSQGVEVGSIVGICTGRNIEMIVCFLAVLKAGAAYLPIDPSYPSARISYMLSDSTAGLLLTIDSLVESMSEYETESCKLLRVDGDWAERIESFEDTNLNVSLSSDNLFNIIYTSGTSGKPKGVMVHHRGICNTITWHRREFAENASSRSVQTVAPAFDPVALEIYPFLVAGGSVHIVDDEVRSNPPKLLNWMAENGITHSTLITPIAEAMIDLQLPKDLKLKVLMVGGDKLHRGFRKTVPFRFENEYGPSEASIMASHYTVSPGIDHPPPIGKPIANTKLYVVNKFLQQLPVGVPGELLIAGEGVTKGYLNRPDLTQEKFVTNPFVETQGPSNDNERASLAYRTGDLVKRLADGNIDFIGRVDLQVKVRGYRIELGEIEACISQYPSVRENVVIVREDSPGVKRLVGYLIIDNTRFTMSGLKSYLKSKLPDYMVPSAFVELNIFPLTPNEKIDKKALPPPTDSHTNFVPPSNPIEEKLVAIWSRILGHPELGVTDNFFALGGHSLSATQLISQIQQEFGLELPLSCIFESPTIAGLAEVLASEDLPHLSCPDLSLEVDLEETINLQRLPCGNYSQPEFVFLTGASGFLGAHLLYDILSTSNAAVYCLIRAQDTNHAMQRLDKIFESYNIHLDPNQRARIIPAPGDLSQPHLGLMPSLFKSICDNVSVIYHNGSEVNFMYPYASLKPANVESTKEILRIATTTILKAVHYVSTLSVFGSECHNRKEDDPLPLSTVVHGGYAQTKWVSEMLVLLASSRGVPTTVLRPGRITGHSKTGCCNTDDFFCRFLKGCVQMNAAPEQPGDADMIPVDFVSRAITHITLHAGAEALGHCYHFSNPHSFSWPQLYDWMNDSGFPLSTLPFSDWLQQLKESGKGNALYPLIPVFSLGAPDTEAPSYDFSNTNKALASSAVVCPKVDDGLLRIYFDYFISVGFLAKF
jgi:amino acid adenylation domain-containing protein/thioester reductase-like protein